MVTNKKAGGCGSGSTSRMTSNIQDEKIKNTLSKIKHKLIVMSGKGGVGKSSISANIAVSLAGKGYKTGLLDVDLHGPSIARMMGLNGSLDVTGESIAKPKQFNDNLSVVSMQSLLDDEDQAVIWRGPAKTGVIRQFISDVQWGELDFLIIDSPPGTGDEPLSVAQSVSGARAVIVTTPQSVALSDVRKSINFCRTVNLEPVGIIENMGPFSCPCCGEMISPFKSGGGEKTAREANIPFLGTVPFDPQVVKACDQGAPIVGSEASASFSRALVACVDSIIEKL